MEQRWCLLVAIALLGFSSRLAWLAFACSRGSAIAHQVDAFYAHPRATHQISTAYFFVTLAGCILPIYCEKCFGFRVTMRVAVWSNAIGGLLRFFSSALPANGLFNFGFCFATIGHMIAAVAFPFTIPLSTNVAASYFSPILRPIALAFAVAAHPLGVFFANIILPNLVKNPSEVVYLNALTAISSLLPCVAISFAFGNWSFVDERLKPTREMIAKPQDLKCIFKVIFLKLSLHQHNSLWLMTVSFLFGITSMAVCVAGFKLVFESTFPISPTISSTIIMICGQIQSLFFLVLFAVFAQTPQPGDSRLLYQVCSEANEPLDTQDMASSVRITSYITLSCAVMFVALFRQSKRNNKTLGKWQTNGSKREQFKKAY
ncbi:major facilitator superfamily domain-containing protein 7 [Ditylenchus destructor]|nr:major facilitator superfamily domain-containing protein 7 [Ditylenchus destructor]